MKLSQLGKSPDGHLLICPMVDGAQGACGKLDLACHFVHPAKLPGKVSLTILDATNSMENIDMVLERCGIAMDGLQKVQNPPAVQAPTLQVLGRNYSRRFFKNKDGGELRRLQNQINNLLAKEGVQQAVLITYKDLCGRAEEFLAGVPRLVVLDGIHFGGQITGHNRVGEYFKEHGIALDKAGLVVLGTPRPNPMEVCVRAFALGYFGPGDSIPEFDKDNMASDWFPNASHEVKFMSYKAPLWRQLEMFAIRREILQAVGRGAFRGIRTYVIGNFPLLTLNAKRGGWGDFVGEVGLKGFETRLKVEQILLDMKTTGWPEKVNKGDIAGRVGLNSTSGTNLRFVGECLNGYL